MPIWLDMFQKFHIIKFNSKLCMVNNTCGHCFSMFVCIIIIKCMIVVTWTFICNYTIELWHMATLAYGHTPIVISSPWGDWQTATLVYGHTIIVISYPWGKCHMGTLTYEQTPLAISSPWENDTWHTGTHTSMDWFDVRGSETPLFSLLWNGKLRNPPLVRDNC